MFGVVRKTTDEFLETSSEVAMVWRQVWLDGDPEQIAILAGPDEHVGFRIRLDCAFEK